MPEKVLLGTLTDRRIMKLESRFENCRNHIFLEEISESDLAIKKYTRVQQLLVSKRAQFLNRKSSMMACERPYGKNSSLPFRAKSKSEMQLLSNVKFVNILCELIHIYYPTKVRLFQDRTLNFHANVNFT